MPRRVKFREILSLEDVPVTVKQGTPLPFGQSEQSLSVLGVTFLKKFVVREQGRNEYPPKSVVTYKGLACRGGVNEPRLYPSVADSTGVGGGLYLLRVVVCATDTGDKVNILALCEVCQLVKADDVILRRLILIDVQLTCTVAKVNDRTVDEFSRVARLVEAVYFLWVKRQGKPYQRLVKLGKGAPQNQLL